MFDNNYQEFIPLPPSINNHILLRGPDYINKTIYEIQLSEHSPIYDEIGRASCRERV